MDIVKGLFLNIFWMITSKTCRQEHLKVENHTRRKYMSCAQTRRFTLLNESTSHVNGDTVRYINFAINLDNLSARSVETLLSVSTLLCAVSKYL